MMRKLVLTCLILLLAACQSTPAPGLPTVVVLPTLTALPTDTEAPSTLEVAVLPTATDTLAPTVRPTVAEPTIPPTATATPSPTWTPQPSLTSTDTPTVTRTPSLTITNTNTVPPTTTFTPTMPLSGMGSLGELAARTTILPPDQLYNAPTLTAFHIAEQTQIAGRNVIVALSPDFGTPAAVGVPTTSAATPVICMIPPPATLSGVLAVDPVLQSQIGCPLSIAATQSSGASQLFERGLMVYLAGTPGQIYSLSNDGTFRVFTDTWTSGVDPDSLGEVPPAGLLEPVRGFGKVWRTNLDVRAALGWAVVPEAGDTVSILAFEHGRAIYLPGRAQTVLLVDDFGGLTGRWRAFGGGF